MRGRRARRSREMVRRAAIAIASVTGGLLLVTAAYLWLLGGTSPQHVPAIGGPFTLTEDNGTVVTDRDFRGDYLLIYFGYTRCPDICPLTLSAMAKALDLLGPRAARLRPLFITVDPQHDTPAVLRAYLQKFSSAIIGLSGSAAQIDAVEREFHVTSTIHRTGPAADDYLVDHTAVLFLIGPDGRYLAPFAADETGPELAKHLVPYLKG